MVLCLPSPSCVNREGERVGNGRVDLFGDEVRCQNLPGGNWTTRHDRLKMELMTMFDWAGVTATCEAWGLFSHLVPQAAMAREEVRNQVEVMRPDFKLELRNQTSGQVESRVAELKFYCARGFYKSGVRQHRFQRAVEARSLEVINL